MKANKLQIGDWVHYWILNINAKVNDVMSTGRLGIRFIDSKGKEGYIHGVICETVAPIPLTEEILVKNGFVQSGSKFTCGEISVIFTIKGFSFWTKHMINIAADNGSRINNLHRYVHELQHALRLCRINKEITI